MAQLWSTGADLSPRASSAGGRRPRDAGAAAPRRLDVVPAADRPLTEIAQRGPVGEPRAAGGQPPQAVHVHERHEPVGEAGHRARHADAADVGAAADAVHPAANGDVALDDRAAAAELHEARPAVARLLREVVTVVEAGLVAAVVHGPVEEPARAALVVEVELWPDPGEPEHELQQRLGQVVRLNRAAREVD